MMARLSATAMDTSVEITVSDPGESLDGERSAARMRLLLADAASKAYAALYPHMERWDPR